MNKIVFMGFTETIKSIINAQPAGPNISSDARLIKVNLLYLI
jgi:hypothetical protein